MSVIARGAATFVVLGTLLGGAVAEAAGPAPGGPDRAPGGAAGEPMCGNYEALHTLLADQFDERPTSSGLADDGSIMQVFASSTAGTWTLVSVDPRGTACIVATGQGWSQETVIGMGEPA